MDAVQMLIVYAICGVIYGFFHFHEIYALIPKREQRDLSPEQNRLVGHLIPWLLGVLLMLIWPVLFAVDVLGLWRWIWPRK